MTTERTVPIEIQRPAFDVLVSLAAQYPTLPAGYVTLMAHPGGYLGTLDLQMDTAADFEAWRDALEIPTDGITLNSASTHNWLEGTTTVLDVTVKVTGTVALTYAEYYAPRDRNEVAA